MQRTRPSIVSTVMCLFFKKGNEKSPAGDRAEQSSKLLDAEGCEIRKNVNGCSFPWGKLPHPSLTSEG